MRSSSLFATVAVLGACLPAQNSFQKWDGTTEFAATGGLGPSGGFLSQAYPHSITAGLRRLTGLKYVVQEQNAATPAVRGATRDPLRCRLTGLPRNPDRRDLLAARAGDQVLDRHPQLPDPGEHPEELRAVARRLGLPDDRGSQRALGSHVACPAEPGPAVRGASPGRVAADRAREPNRRGAGVGVADACE